MDGTPLKEIPATCFICLENKRFYSIKGKNATEDAIIQKLSSISEYKSMSDVPAYLKGRGRGRGLTGPKQPAPHHNGPGRGMGTGKQTNKGPVTMERSVPTAPSAEERFQSASEQNQESIKRHLGENSAAVDDLSDEEDDLDAGVLQKVFQTYTVSEGDDLNIGAAQDNLLHSFRSGTSACLVCIDAIKKTDPIWSCEGCCAIFHIQCIQKWVKDGVYHQIYKSEDDNLRPESIPWHCPKCRLEYDQRRCPTRYLCYCGKVEEPQFDPWLVPHSCGATCGRPLKPDCGHTCLLLCHPGACPPCPKTVRVGCHCGKAAPQVRRCSARPWSCTGVCGRRLTCGQHTCQQTCHSGECSPCPMTSSQRCQCGKSSSVRPCASPDWQCDQVCGKRLSCGNHVCESVCHRGPCGDCPRGGVRKCPCGKTEYDKPCTEDIPTCGDTCGKLLACGIHSCVQRCHYGSCGSCLQMCVKRCRCSQGKEREVTCSKDFLCETKCTKMRDCAKHQCKRKCCDGNCPPCEQMCNKPLTCKYHKCSSRCHRGRCYPCMETVDMFCSCKATKITVPCGREKVTKPPRCNHPCKNPPDCHHPERIKHRCHFGECPTCRQVCHKQLPNCSHVCPASCHTAVKVKYKDNKKRAGPWEGGPRIIEQVVDRPCPPCMVPIAIQCYGMHETGSFACSVVKPYSCGRQCGRNLICGNHTCSRMCHVVEGSQEPVMAGTNCQKCELGCQFERPEGCTHPCQKPCHQDACPPCTQMFRMRCHCQASIRHVECYKWVASSDSKKEEMKTCGGPCPKVLSCGHQCSLLCHPGACSRADQCERKVTVKCKCKRQKRDVKCRDSNKEKAQLQCDDKCKQEIQRKKQIEDEAAKQQAAEEEKKRQAELEEYERKMKGRRRKQRKHAEVEVEERFLTRNRTAILTISASVLCLAVFVYYIMTVV
ncbi:NF-X1-type zinc finger protein NFXL1-like isoform X2 [Mya arenaria]|uniref:NF-X1-type zinc finger protein NFXL1-like isoform X2 n=1 Tax=Mya arenaria TaxID=6604 RepID=UPI0022E2D958|nr:NF-X1-type zinc finger protein NFXL1-like isoform X2 [Mya arenaria]